jgi:hypothetical protein
VEEHIGRAVAFQLERPRFVSPELQTVLEQRLNGAARANSPRL